MWILILPWLLCLLLLALGGSLFKKWWKCSAAIAVCIVILNVYGRVFSMGFIQHLLTVDEAKTMKVMTWNINGMEYDSLKVEGIVERIRGESPDFVFLAENFGTGTQIHKKLRCLYPYSSLDVVDCHHCAYCRYPIDSIAYIETDVNDQVKPLRFYMNVLGVDLCIYGCHLASNNYSEHKEDLHLDSVNTQGDVYRYLENIKNASAWREKQVDAILADRSRMGCERNIVMGDMNDISGSTPLRKLENVGISDAWWKGGFGYGATITYPLPYRIDHIMYDDGLKLISIKKVCANGLSDHDALVATFSFKYKCK